jgi:hypothetical protein
MHRAGRIHNDQILRVMESVETRRNAAAAATAGRNSPQTDKPANPTWTVGYSRFEIGLRAPILGLIHNSTQGRRFPPLLPAGSGRRQFTLTPLDS